MMFVVSFFHISPPANRPIKKALRTQISPGLIGGEIRIDVLGILLNVNKLVWNINILFSY